MVTQRVLGSLRRRRSWIAAALLALLAWVAWEIQSNRPALAQDDPVVKAYPCPAGHAAAIAEHLREELGAVDGVRVAADPRTSQVVVQAPKEVQVWIAQRLAGNADFKTDGPGRAVGAPQTRTVKLQRLSTAQIETSLGDILGERLMPVSSPREQVRAYRVALTSGSIDVNLDAGSSQVKLSGSGPAVDAAVRLIQILDGPPEGGRNIRLLPLRTAHLDDVQRAMAAIRTVANTAPNKPSTLAFYQTKADDARGGTPPANPRAAGDANRHRAAGATGESRPAAGRAGRGRAGRRVGQSRPDRDAAGAGRPRAQGQSGGRRAGGPIHQAGRGADAH